MVERAASGEELPRACGAAAAGARARSAIARQAAPVAAVALTFCAGAAASWGKWPDVLVDFGHELYIPWRLAEGAVLGRDVVGAATGPLSPYLNALVFSVFGPGLATVVAVNLVVLAAITWLVWDLARAVGDRVAATTAALAFLAVFAFGQYVGIGNYNYVTPYSHGATHGMLLSLGALALARRGRSRGHLGAAGATVGLAFLTKPEIFVACAAGVAVAVAGVASAMSLRRRVLLVGGAALAVPALAWGLLLLVLPAGEAGRVVAGPWLLAGSPLLRTPFYLSVTGLDDAAGNLAAIVGWTVAVSAAAGAVALADRAAARAGLGRAAALAAGFAAGFAPLVAAGAALPWDEAWTEAARPLPLLVLAGACAHAVRAVRARDPGEREHAVAGLAAAVFAGALLGKMLLNPRIAHYGFVLAMPASVLVIAWATSSVPALLRARGGSGEVFRGATLAAVLVVAAAHVRVSASAFEAKDVPVGAGRDRFLADWRGAFVNASLEQLEAVAAPGDTLAVIPEGIMVNFLARRRNPSPYPTYLPDAVAAFGERDMLASYVADPPRFVLVVERDASELGARTFGGDYAVETARWLAANYETVDVTAAPDGSYGMALLRWRHGR